ncbi:NADH pyrophosphatase [anaerobic digester metagenome]|jgi:NAD+ diphosphatase|uniref:NAD(+) diphosphatase n=1 Tax=Methanobacterium subterraneum TaxID=59277 RepID=A0A2H4VNW3_9EURY|nr:NAD(+) diphosphatase [Methanobacterium subterraneum]AUB59756.1 NADH pyrophosphatase [Methanobacterium subterraneum]
MHRESIYRRYKPEFTPNKENNGNAYWFLFNSNELLVEMGKIPEIPYTKSLEELKINPIRLQYLGTFNGHPCYSGELPSEIQVPRGMAFKDLRSLYDIIEEDLYLLAGRASQIVNWDRSHQFCGQCGAPTITKDDEMAKLCPECGFTSFTRLSPAVITAIIKDGKLLMALHTRTSGNMYGLIAGFVEPGETLTEAVQRETMEEVGLKVKNIEYFGSQPWPYPHSLMIGFTADYDSGEIEVDGKEIIDAKWFDSDQLPQVPSRMSIAGELIQWYLENYSI